VVRLKSIEILSNLFRSVIALSPDTLLHCVYLCLNRLAPAYEAIELGIGESILLKAIAQSTGITQLSSNASLNSLQLCVCFAVQAVAENISVHSVTQESLWHMSLIVYFTNVLQP